MPAKLSKSKSSRSPSRLRLVMPLFLAGMFIACAGIALKRMSVRTADVETVRHEVAEIIAGRGYIGPFFMQAASRDTETGEFTDFKAETDHLLIAAARASIDVNASTDTISLLLTNVTIVRVPSGEVDMPVVHRDSYLLGPFPYRGNIVESDRPSERGMNSASPR